MSEANTTGTLLRVYPELLFAWHGHSLLITNRAGKIERGLEGLYWHDLRLLSRYALLVNGQPPSLDSLSAVDPYSTLGYYYSKPAQDAHERHDALGLPKQELDRQVVIRVARFVGQGLHEDVEVSNHGQSDAELEIAWEVDNDFADLIEARGGERQQEAPVEHHWQQPGDGSAELRFHYTHPQLDRGVLVRFECHGVMPGAQPPRYENGRVIDTLRLGSQETRHYCIKVSPVVEGQVREPAFECDAFGSAPTESDRTGRRWTSSATRLRTGNPVVQLTWDRAVSDLASLALGDGDTGAELIVPAAGIPLFGTLFGRDALTIAGQSLLLSPLIAEGALRMLSRFVGRSTDDFYDMQPGRIPQQVRDDPLALLSMNPWLHDYGDYAAPCAFLVLLGGYHVTTGNTEVTREFLDAARLVLDWLDGQADLDGDGFLEYKTRSPQGQRHQGWKDSGDAVRYEDGREAEPPVAPCEIQGYWYAAKVLMAEVFLALGEEGKALDQLRGALALRKRFNQSFWMPDKRFIAFALDADKRQVKTIASNAGHCLATGILEHKYARPVVRRLMSPDMFSGWGIRTLSSEHPAYNPLKYHLGSVWPVENATMAFGMKRYGFHEESAALVRAMFEAADLFEYHRLPEVFGGFPRDARHPHPGIYPDACAPQGWSASAVVWLVQSLIGLWSYAPLKVLLLDPHLPAWLPELTLYDIPVGEARVSIRFKRRANGSTGFRVIRREGEVRVVRQSPPDTLAAGPFQRLQQALGSFPF